MTTNYPVHYTVMRPARFTPLQLLVRVAAFIVIGAAGTSFGGLFALGYVMLPLIAASRLAARDPNAFLREDGPRITTALRWIAAVAGWAGLVIDELPLRIPEGTLRLSIEGLARPTPGAAIARLLTGLPSALVLSVLCAFGVLVWLWAATSVLFTGQIGPAAFEYLVGLQRWSIRLLAYQASLVDEYPPFSFADSPVGDDAGALPKVAS